MSFVEQVFFPKLSKNPPDGFNVFITAGHIRVFHVNPESAPGDHFTPLALVFKDALSAFFYKSFYAIFFDVLLAFDTKLSFNLKLYRQTMGVPTGLATNMAAAHGLISGNKVFHGFGQNMPRVWGAVSGWRPLKKCEFFAAFAVADRLLKNFFRFPEFENFFFSLR